MSLEPQIRRKCEAAMPSPVVTIAMHGSASTWIFNVVRELALAAYGEGAVWSGFAEELKDLPPPEVWTSQALVIKAHYVRPELDAWMKAQAAETVLSLRDPRDAAISMAQRFQAPLAHAVEWIACDCERLAPRFDEGRSVLRYEEKFFDDRASIERIGGMIALPTDPALEATIFARYRREAVRDFAARIAELPPERLGRVGKFNMDQLTQFHEIHVGDGQVGKWRNLAPDTRRALTIRFRPFLDRFGYAI